MATPRILVCGSRNWTDRETVARAILNAWLELRDAGSPVLVSGACPTGADALAESVWASQQVGPVERHPADWAGLGRRAGFVRNKQMVDLGADVCLAFATTCTKTGCGRPAGHLSHGTASTVDLCRAAGIPVRLYTGSPDDPAQL